MSHVFLFIGRVLRLVLPSGFTLARDVFLSSLQQSRRESNCLNRVRQTTNRETKFVETVCFGTHREE